MSTIAERVARVRQAFDSRRTRPYAWRVAQLKGLKRFLEEKGPEIQKALWADLRKGAFETAVTESGVVMSEIDFTLPRLAEWMEIQPVSTPLIDQIGHSEIRPEPYGVALIIGAWNYPVNLMLAPLVGALAGGNAAVLKPSELAPATSAVMAKFIPEYLDPEAVMVYEGGVPETDALLDCKFDYIFFTGSGPVGKIVMRKAAEHLTPVTLELGGKSPCVVMDDASVKVAARRTAWGKFMNAGQTCIAPDYVLIHPSVKDEFVRELKLSIETFYGKDPIVSADYCRIVNDRNYQRLAKFLGDGEILAGGRTDAPTRYIEPTILKVASGEVGVMREEIFGPILPILEVSDVGQAIAFINARPKPLALYLFSNRDAVKERVLDETSSGGVCINDVVMHMPSPYLPFGGVGDSGMGHYHGKRSFDTFTHHKGVLSKSNWPDVPIRYAPYNDSKLKWVKRLS